MHLDRLDWISQVTESPIDPGRPIVDPHHHLWKRGGSTYLAPQLVADTTATHRVIGTVFVECLAAYRTDGPAALRPVGEVEFVAAEAAKVDQLGSPPILGIVAFADLSLGAAVDEVLVAHEEAGGGRFCGVRHATAYDPRGGVRPAHTRPAPGLMLDRPFRDGLRALAGRELTYDAWLYHPQIPELVATADAVPGLTIVLNHLGAPLATGPYAGRWDQTLDEWRRALRALADRPNVVVKLGGIGMENLFANGWPERAAPPSSEEVATRWQGPIRWCIETFGPERCMFESNYPVDRQAIGYGVLWNAFQRIAAAYDDAEQDALFARTAARVYRLNL